MLRMRISRGVTGALGSLASGSPARLYWHASRPRFMRLIMSGFVPESLVPIAWEMRRRCWAVRLRSQSCCVGEKRAGVRRIVGLSGRRLLIYE